MFGSWKIMFKCSWQLVRVIYIAIYKKELNKPACLFAWDLLVYTSWKYSILTRMLRRNLMSKKEPLFRSCRIFCRRIQQPVLHYLLL